MRLFAHYSALFALKPINHRMPHKKFRMLIYVILMVIFLGSCASSRYGCYYPDLPPQYNSEGEIINQ